MKLNHFLLRSQFTQDLPPETNPQRWQGMLRWLNTRLTRNDGIDFEKEIREENDDYWKWREEIYDLRHKYDYSLDA